MTAVGFLIILALILIPWFYAQAKWRGIRPRDVHTNLSPAQLRAAFESKVVGSTWKVHDDGNPMVAISRLMGGIRQQLSLGIVETENGTSARICVARVTFRLTGPSKAYTLQMRMSGFVSEVQRMDPGARVVDLPVDKRLSCNAFPDINGGVRASSPSPVQAMLDQRAASAAEPTVADVAPAVADAAPTPEEVDQPALDAICGEAGCGQPAPIGGLCALHELRAKSSGSADAAGSRPEATAEVSEAVAGWYPDPRGAAELRWWDGSVWTDETHSTAS